MSRALLKELVDAGIEFTKNKNIVGGYIIDIYYYLCEKWIERNKIYNFSVNKVKKNYFKGRQVEITKDFKEILSYYSNNNLIKLTIRKEEMGCAAFDSYEIKEIRLI